MNDRTSTLLVTASATALAVAWRLWSHWRIHAVAPPPSAPGPHRKWSAAPHGPRAQEGLTAKQVLAALTLTRPLIHRHPALPILETVLLEPGSLTATDLESRLTVAVPDLTVPPVCVHATRLRNALRLLTGPLTLVLDGEALV